MWSGKADFYNSCNITVIVIGTDRVLNFFVTNNNPFFKFIISLLKMVYSVQVCMCATAAASAAGIAEEQ